MGFEEQERSILLVLSRYCRGAVRKMKLGVVYPQTEFGSDPAAIKDYAQIAEELGFTHVLAYDHVLGANPDRPGGWKGTYTYVNPFLEPFVLFSFMAAVTQQLGFISGVLILPQRQTALAAKQAATLDRLCAGRLRVGIGLGWNKVEYTALGEDFHQRGRRVEEQVEVLRKLWTEPLVTYDGKYHHIPDAGLNPLPIQQPIPIWFGGQAEIVLRRTARMGDGWLPNHRSVEDTKRDFDTLMRLLHENGRSLDGFGVEPRLNISSGGPEVWGQIFRAYMEMGATHLSVNTMGAGLDTPQKHIQALREVAKLLL
jgi:probable F420-dependent oxidoreductase